MCQHILSNSIQNRKTITAQTHRDYPKASLRNAPCPREKNIAWKSILLFCDITNWLINLYAIYIIKFFYSLAFVTYFDSIVLFIKQVGQIFCVYKTKHARPVLFAK